MTETECMDCDWSENCDWELIVANFSPMTPKCQHKIWHEKSLNVFEEQKLTLRNKLEKGLPDLPKLEINPNDVSYVNIHTGKTLTVGQYYKNCQTSNWDAFG